MNETYVKPMKLTVNKTGETYELDFNREAIYVMDRDGFKIDSVVDFPTTNVPKLFFYAFRMHHRKMQKAQTDAILRDHLHGLTPSMIERLILLYNQAATADNVQEEEDFEKNAEVTVEM